MSSRVLLTADAEKGPMCFRESPYLWVSVLNVASIRCQSAECEVAGVSCPK